jgi:hypothetical protein
MRAEDIFDSDEYSCSLAERRPWHITRRGRSVRAAAGLRVVEK